MTLNRIARTGWCVPMGALAVLVCLWVRQLEGQARDPSVITIEHVTVIDPAAFDEREARIPDRTVLIEGDRIVAVGPANGALVPEGAYRIDGRGKFVLPGFWDMHVHFNRDEETLLRVVAPLMIAHGITSVRDLMADCWEPCRSGARSLSEMRDLQRRIERGEVVAPRLQALSSAVLHGPTAGFGYPAQHPDYWRPRSEEQAREVARYLVARGVDFIKAYQSLPPEAYFGLLDEARKLDVRVSGHLPWGVHPIDAARAGVRTIEHARWPGLACNPEYDAFRAMNANVARGEGEFDRELFARFRDAVVSQFDETRCLAIFEALVAHDVYLVPTHLTREMDAFARDSTYRNDPRRRYVPSSRLRGWDRDLLNTRNGPPELLEFYREFFDLGLRVTGMAHAAGVKVLVGTDVFDTMVFPGFSYHEELEHLRAAGLTPLAIVKAATYRAAEFLGKTADYGAIAPGKVADLIVLDADPLADIGHSRSIDHVVFNGRVYDRSTLDAMIDGVEKYVAGRR